MTIFKETEEGCIQNTVKMKAISLFADHMQLMIPEEMEEMPEQQKRMYYPYKEKPENIWWRPDGEVQMTFQQLAKELKHEKVYDATIEVSHLLKRHNPRMRIDRVHWFAGNEVIGWFVMELCAGKREKKHVKFVMELEGYFTLGTITYPIDEQEKWAVLIKYIFSSINGHVGKNNEKNGM